MNISIDFLLAFGLMSSMAIFISGKRIAINHSYIMTLLYHDHDIEVLSIVILQIIPLTVNYLFSTALTVSGKNLIHESIIYRQYTS